MGTGFSNEDMLRLILERIGGLDEKVDRLNTEFSELNANGCARRSDDVKRLEALEAFREKSITATIGALVTSGGALVAFIVSHLFGHKS